MLRRTFVAGVAAAGGALVTRTIVFAQTAPDRATGTPGGIEMTAAAPQTGYAPVNGLKMYYEVHGTGRPLVLLHGGFGTIETDFGQLLPALAQTRQVIGVEQQAHGHTADVDRPLRYEQMADDVAALMTYLGVENADLFGFSLGGNTALQVAIRHPGLVRKLVVLSANYRRDGWTPEVYAVVETLTPDMLAGSPWYEAYLKVAPNPQDFPALVEKIKELNRTLVGWPDEAVQAITAPTFVIIGDADHVRPEHAVEMFRLVGGGGPGDLTGLPLSQLAVLPGTTHIGAIGRTELLLAIVPPFLDAPPPEGR
jgi:pimeloyl-ACP methyl ester carboxylesterase